MSDITKCKGDRCVIRSNCKRYTAPDNELWQPYFTESPVDDSGTRCEMFWGPSQDSIMDQLNKIVKPKKK